MSFLTLSPSRPRAAALRRPAPSRLFALLASPLVALVREWRVHLAVGALSRLDEAALADIGLPRGDIEAAARHGRSALRR